MLVETLSLAAFASFASVASSASAPLFLFSNEVTLKDTSLLIDNNQPTGYSVDNVMENLVDYIDCKYDSYIFMSASGVKYENLDHDGSSYLKVLATDSQSYVELPALYRAEDISYEPKLNALATSVAAKCKTNLAPSKVGDTVVSSDDKLTYAFTSSSTGGDLASYESYLKQVINDLKSPNYFVAFFGLNDENSVDTTKVIGGVDAALGSDPRLGNDTLPEGGLFSRYQFFSPGIFMTSLVALLLIIIFFNALSWVADLKISYVAFEPKK